VLQGECATEECGHVCLQLKLKTAVSPFQPPIQCLSGALHLGVKRPEHEADHSPQSSVGIKNAWSYTSIHAILLHYMVLWYRDNFIKYIFQCVG
jgi:hypothetical protein